MPEIPLVNPKNIKRDAPQHLRKYGRGVDTKSVWCVAPIFCATHICCCKWSSPWHEDCAWWHCQRQSNARYSKPSDAQVVFSLNDTVAVNKLVSFQGTMTDIILIRELHTGKWPLLPPSLEAACTVRERVLCIITELNYCFIAKCKPGARVHTFYRVGPWVGLYRQRNETFYYWHSHNTPVHANSWVGYFFTIRPLECWDSSSDRELAIIERLILTSHSFIFYAMQDQSSNCHQF